MSVDPQGQSRLVSTILADADEEARRMLSEAEESIATRRTTLKARLERLQAEGDQEIEGIRRESRIATEAAIALAESRATLTRQSQVHRLVINSVTGELDQHRNRPDYAEVIARWIVEATLGLASDSLVLICNPRETEAVELALPAAMALLEEQQKSGIAISIEPDDGLRAQGIVLRTRDGRIEYRNTVEDRMHRLAPQIRQLVQKELPEVFHG